MSNSGNQFDRTERLVGKDAVSALARAHVAVFGIGGVGGFVCEALARAGIGSFTLVDKDDVDITNLNRQIVALHSTIGKDKADVMRDRIADINPAARVEAVKAFFLPENAYMFDFSAFDYVVDAVDTVTAKIELIVRAKAAGVPVISSMGTGNKLDPTMFKIDDIYKTSVCPLAKVMRKELKARGVESLKVLYSEEIPMSPIGDDRRTPASISFVPSVAGLIIAGEVIKDILQLT